MLDGLGRRRPRRPQSPASSTATRSRPTPASASASSRSTPPSCRTSECYAQEASAALGDLLPPGAEIRLEADPRLDDVDRFGRLLRYVHRGEQNVNLELVRSGAASVWFFEGDRGRYADELLEAARTARDAGRGLWGACPSTPLDPERAVDTR